MAEQNVSAELEKFRQYLRKDNNEDAKRPLLYPLFQKLFKDKFKIESDAHGADVYVEGQLLVESKTGHHSWLDAFYQALHLDDCCLKGGKLRDDLALDSK